ncbi:MAG: nuclear transport factor 2 family protein [Acidimicrobiales bacterium]
MEPTERVTAYFDACTTGTPAEIAAHFTPDAVIYDTNIAPVRGAATIGEMWVTVRDRWQGAAWTVTSIVAEGDAAAIEWQMTGTDPRTRKRFVFRGSEHYRFAADTLIDEIRQYWTYDRDHLDTGLVGFPPHQGPAG